MRRRTAFLLLGAAALAVAARASDARVAVDPKAVMEALPLALDAADLFARPTARTASIGPWTAERAARELVALAEECRHA